MARRRYRDQGPDPTWTEDVGGQEIEFTLLRDTGQFLAEFAGETLRAKTRDELIEKARKLVAKSLRDVAIPVTLIDYQAYDNSTPFRKIRGWRRGGVGVRHATLLGVHRGNGRIRAKDDLTGERFLVDRWSGDDDLVRRLTDPEVEEYTRLRIALQEAQAAWDGWYTARRIHSAADLVNEELAKAADDPQEPPEVDDDPR